MPRKRLVDAVGPFTGMRRTMIQGVERDPSLCNYLYNMTAIATGGVRVRPGVYRRNTSALGSGGARIVQLIHEFYKQDGTRVSIVVVGGIVYTRDDWGGAGSFTTALSQADLTSASIALSQSARISAVTIGNQVVFSDGVNTPFMWDGTTGGGLTELTNAPVFYGPIVVHYGKVFGIKSTDRTTFVWSEENDPTTGYEAGGFNNAWTFSQTDATPLTALLATNDGLYVFRTGGIGVVLGAVTTDFSSAGTRNAVSEEVGTRSPWGVCYHEGTIWFIDQTGLVWNLPVGDKPNPWWRANMSQDGHFNIDQVFDEPTGLTTHGNWWHRVGPAFSLEEREIVVRPAERGVAGLTTDVGELQALILVGCSWDGAADGFHSHLVAIDSTTQRLAGVWQFWNGTNPITGVTRIGAVMDGSGDTNAEEHLIYGTDDGFVYSDFAGQSTDIGPDGTSHDITWQIVGPKQFDNRREILQMLQLDLVLTPADTSDSIRVNWITPRKFGRGDDDDADPITVALTTIPSTHNEAEVRVPIGLPPETGRWFYIVIDNSGLGTVAAVIHGWDLTVALDAMEPRGV